MENVALHVHMLVIVIRVILIIAMQILNCVWNVSVCMCGSEMVSCRFRFTANFAVPCQCVCAFLQDNYYFLYLLHKAANNLDYMQQEVSANFLACNS